MYSPHPPTPPADLPPPARPRRQAPAVTREWPATDPRPDRSLDLYIWTILVASLASAVLLRDPLLLLLAGTLVIGLATLHILLAAMRRQAARPRSALGKAGGDISNGEHPQPPETAPRGPTPSLY